MLHVTGIVIDIVMIVRRLSDLVLIMLHESSIVMHIFIGDNRMGRIGSGIMAFCLLLLRLILLLHSMLHILRPIVVTIDRMIAVSTDAIVISVWSHILVVLKMG